MNKILFVMFQGAGTAVNISGNSSKFCVWQNDTKFLNKLKKIGDIFVYQNKLYNVNHYDKSNPDFDDYEPDINFNVDYLDMDKHIEMIYNIIKKYKGKFVPVGWSVGGLFALAFAKKYESRCKLCILLDSVIITPKALKCRIAEYKKRKLMKKLTNINLKKIQYNIIKTGDKNDIKLLIDTVMHRWTIWIKNNIKKLPIKTLSFSNIDIPCLSSDKCFNSILRINEQKLLSKSKNYQYYNYINKGHFLGLEHQDVATDIIKKLNTFLENTQSD